MHYTSDSFSPRSRELPQKANTLRSRTRQDQYALVYGIAIIVRSSYIIFLSQDLPFPTSLIFKKIFPPDPLRKKNYFQLKFSYVNWNFSQKNQQFFRIKSL